VTAFGMIGEGSHGLSYRIDGSPCRVWAFLDQKGLKT